MVRNNNIISNNHFHKNWQKLIRQNFKQPFKKVKRSLSRIQKMKKNLPRPINTLRPLINCSTVRYQAKQRFGRGFSLQELKSANINSKYAKSIGISIDHRRRNKSFESVLVNKLRLQTYFSKVIVFTKKGEQSKVMGAVIKKGLNRLEWNKKTIRARKPSNEEKAFPAFITLRTARLKSKKQHRKNKRVNVRSDGFEEKQV